jgi:imidazolonepropionase-like amidohydrolase
MIVIQGGKILTIANGDIAEGSILIDGGKIVEVGEHISAPDDAEVIDARGSVVVPGLVDAHTHLGLGGLGGANESSSPVTPHVRIIDALDFTDPGFQEAYEGGVTTVITTPGSGNVIGGTSLVMKTAGATAEDRVIRDPAAMKMAWRKGMNRPSSGPPYPMSAMGVVGIIRNAFVETKNYMEQREAGIVGEDPGKEQLAKVLKGELICRIHSFTPLELKALMRLQDEFGFDFTVEHGFEAHLVAEDLAARGIPVVYGPGPVCRRHKLFPQRGPHVPALLHKAGVKVSLQTDHPDQNIKGLRILGAYLLRYTDLTPSDVMRMLTINGAEIAGVDNRVGTIEAGKDADIAIFSDHPLKVQARVERLFVDGNQVFQRQT